ncbi:ankyrin repeat domain-containing protein 45 isoform X2 [Ranitomeya variabilis]|uniref:ankyrin repeat domain-containing protein 45 isoform X2 n=1 Tax=Ranitomeya variabilis TaxID=490064 RepID=UPI004057B92B
MEVSGPPDNPVLRCALEGNVPALQSIFEDSADDHHEQCNTFLVEEDLLGRNPLFLACVLGRTEVVRALAKYGANVNQKTARGYSALHCAAAWGRLDVLKALVDLGGDISLLNFRGEKAGEIASRYNKTDCVDFLKWAEARLALKAYISFIQQTIADPEKVHGKLNKEDKISVFLFLRTKRSMLANQKMNGCKTPRIQQHKTFWIRSNN